MRQMSSNAIQPNTCALYALDWISDLLKQRIAMPAEDGTPQPLTFGEFLCTAQAVGGWSADTPIKTATFEGDNFNELDHLMVSGGASGSLVTPGLTKSWAFRVQTTGASQSVYGQLDLPNPAGEMFVTGNFRVQAAPSTFADKNCHLMRFTNAAGANILDVSVETSGVLHEASMGESKFKISAYIGQKLPFAIWLRAGNPGYIGLWINGDEVLSYTGNTSGLSPASFLFGAIVDSVAENWTVDFDDLQVYNRYYENAFQVFGGPFQGIGPVYIDGVSQPDSQTLGGYTQTVTRFPNWGIVQFSSTNPNFKPGNTVQMRVIMNPGGMHPVDIISALLTQAGADGYIDTTNFAAAKAATPGDLINARFEDKGSNNSVPNQVQGLKDYQNSGVTVADAIKEIVSRCLYFFFVDIGKIKIIPYLGTPPTGPVLDLDASSMFECDPIIDMDTLTTYVGVTYGAYATNPNLYYLAGLSSPEGQGASLDFTWGSPVASESYDMAKAKADLLLKFLSAQERLDPVRMNLAGMRLELMDAVSAYDQVLMDAPINYWLMRKQINLDAPHLAGGSNREVDLQLMRFLGEN